MEKEELIISENQIMIDFDSLELSQEEEVSQILPEGFVISKNNKWIEEEVLFVVVKVEKDISYKLDLCGKTLLDWVLLAGSGCEQTTIADPKDNLLQKLKELNTEKKYIAVFYSDTPLIEKPLFHKIMDYFSKNGLNVMVLNRGYVVKTDYIKNIDKFASNNTVNFDENAFMVVDNAKSIAKASKLLYDKIRSFHIKNGVTMFGANSIFIDADVEIESGAVIYPNNVIRGQSYIGKATIESGNIISDSIIADNAFVVSSYIEKSKIGSGVSVGPFEKIISSEK